MVRAEDRTFVDIKISHSFRVLVALPNRLFTLDNLLFLIVGRL